MDSTIITVTLTTECECEIYNEDTGEFVPSDGTECFGCYDSAWMDFTENIVTPWLKDIGGDDDSKIVVMGEGMTWQRRSGWTVIPAHSLHEALAIDGQYRVEYRFDGSTLTARRWSHDEPVGTGMFTFTLLDFDINED